MAAADQKDYRSPGEMLRESREERGLSVEDVAEATKISPRMLNALEADEYDELAGPLYARSFLRTLSKYFSLDEEDLFARLEKLDSSVTRPQTPVNVEEGGEGVLPQAPPSAPSNAPEAEAPTTWRVETVDSTQVKHVQAPGSQGRGRYLWIVLAVVVLAVVSWLLLRDGGGNGSEAGQGMSQAEARPEEHLFARSGLPEQAAGEDTTRQLETGGEQNASDERDAEPEPAETLTPTTQPAPGTQQPPQTEAAGPDSGTPIQGTESGSGAQQSAEKESSEPATQPPAENDESESGAQQSTEKQSAEKESTEPATPPPVESADAARDSLPSTASTPPQETVEPQPDADSSGAAQEPASGGGESGTLGSIVRPGVQPPVAGEMRLQLRALKECELWFSIDGGNRQRRRLVVGEVLQLKAQDHFDLQFDDPEAIEAFVDGEARPVPSRPDKGWVIYPN